MASSAKQPAGCRPMNHQTAASCWLPEGRPRCAVTSLRRGSTRTWRARWITYVDAAAISATPRPTASTATPEPCASTSRATSCPPSPIRPRRKRVRAHRDNCVILSASEEFRIFAYVRASTTSSLVPRDDTTFRLAMLCPGEFQRAVTTLRLHAGRAAVPVAWASPRPCRPHLLVCDGGEPTATVAPSSPLVG